MSSIHPSAIIDKNADIAEDVSIGPWTIIGPDVVIDAGCVISSHVVIKGPCYIGKGNRIFQFASIGEDCQDKKYAGEATRLHIGDYNVIREGVTLHRGTVQDKAVTHIGSHNLFMAYTHVAHDCVVGNHVIMANNSALAGHVHLGDYAILGGFTAVHQFCHIGEHVMCGAGTVVLKDVPSYVLTSGNPATPHGINSEGLRRRGFDAETIRLIKQAYKIIYRKGLTIEQTQPFLSELVEQNVLIQSLLDSVVKSERGIIR